MVSKSKSPSRRTSRQSSSRSPSRRITRQSASQSPARTAAVKTPTSTASAKTPAKKPESKSPARPQPKTPASKESASRARSRSSSRSRAKKEAPEKPKPTVSEKPKPASPQADTKSRISGPSSKPMPKPAPSETKAEPRPTREYASPLYSLGSGREVYQRKAAPAAQPETTDAVAKQRRAMMRKRFDTFVSNAQAHVRKNRFLYVFMLMCLLMVFTVFYAGYKVNQGIIRLQKQVVEYVLNVTSSYFSKAKNENKTE